MDKSNAEMRLVELIKQIYECYKQGDINLAVFLAEQALELSRLIYPNNHHSLASKLNILAVLYGLQGKTIAAEQLHEEALSVWRRLCGNFDHSHLADSMHHLALSYQSQGKYSAAEPLYVEALSMWRRLYNDLDCHDLANSIHKLAKIYEFQGKINEAEPLYVESLAMQRRLCGDLDHHDLANSINNLALLYKFQGKYNAAEPLHIEALAMFRRLYKDCDHYNLANSINNLAHSYKSRAKYSEAEPLYKEALAMYRRLYKDCDNNGLAASMNNLAVLYDIQEKHSEAALLNEEALAMRRRLYGDRDHNDLAISINNLALSYQHQGKYSAAESLQLEALTMQQRLFSDRDHYSLAGSFNNLAMLYLYQHKYSKAEPIFLEALAMCRRLFGDRDHNDLAESLDNLAILYIAQHQTEKAFSLMLEAVEVEENILRQWFSYSTESSRLNFVEDNQSRLGKLVSFLCEYFPEESEKIAEVAILVARRKAFAAQAEVELNYLRYSDRYPDLAEDFQELAIIQGKLTHLNHTYYYHQGTMDTEERASNQQVKQTLTEQIDRLEHKLSENVPELRQLQQRVTLKATCDALPENSHIIDFYRLNFHDFVANEWQAPQYVAFILAFGGNVQMVQLGDAEEIDGLIRRYRDLSQDVNLPSFGARPNSSSKQLKPSVEVDDCSIDLQLSQRLLTPILEAIDLEIKHLIFIPDGVVYTLPIGNLPVSSGCLNDRFVCTYLSTLRELLNQTDLSSRQLSASIVIGNPNYNYLAPAITPQLFKPIPESELLLNSLKLKLDSDAQFFTGDRAAETVLKDAKSPKLLVILTHGYLLDEERDQIQLICKLIECTKSEGYDLIQANKHLLNSNFWILLNTIDSTPMHEALEELSAINLARLIIYLNLLDTDQESVQSINPMQNHGLALAGANSWLAGEKLPAEIGKGFLLARDVAYLDLYGTEIVFLIACSSGLGDVKTGEGVFGLRRAFAIAGVKQLITSLWDVPTRPTMLLTDKFFEAYHQGVVPAIALQTAQQYVRDISRTDLAATKLGKEILAEVDRLARCGVRIDDPDYPLRHPYFWGAWICQGV